MSAGLNMILIFALLTTFNQLQGVYGGWKETIATGNARFETAFNTGDFDVIENMFASISDFTFTPTDDKAYDNTAIADWFRARRSEGLTHLQLATDFYTNLQTVAKEIGVYSLSQADGTIVYTGSYLTSWYQDDGPVKITMAMWT